MKTLAYFLADENGATTIEYGLIAALISVVTISIMTTVGNHLVTTFTTVSNALNR